MFCLLYRSWSEKKIECNLPNNNSDLSTFYSICSNKKFVVGGYFSHQQDPPWRYRYVIFKSSSQTQRLKPFLTGSNTYVLIMGSLCVFALALNAILTTHCVNLPGFNCP